MSVDIERIDDWTDLTSSEPLAMCQVEADDEGALCGFASVRGVANIELIEMSTVDGYFCGAERIKPDERGEYVLFLQLAGNSEIVQNGRTATLLEGDIAFFDATRAVSVRVSQRNRSLCLKFPQCFLEILPERVNSLAAVRFSQAENLVSAVHGFITTLDRDFYELSPRCRRELALLAIGVVSVLIHGHSGTLCAPRRSSTDKTVQDMQEYIDAHLADPDLTPRKIAAAYFMSVRCVHRIFNDAGLTIAGWVQHRRLEQCRRDLTDPSMIDVPVGSIGQRWGFKTPSHFGRVFKDQIGLSPYKYRMLTIETASRETV